MNALSSQSIKWIDKSDHKEEKSVSNSNSWSWGEKPTIIERAIAHFHCTLSDGLFSKVFTMLHLVLHMKKHVQGEEDSCVQIRDVNHKFHCDTTVFWFVVQQEDIC